MCGRFSLFSDPPRIARRFGLSIAEAQWQVTLPSSSGHPVKAVH